VWRPVFIAEQSRRPTGLLGRLIGHIMAMETAAVNAEALTLLDLRPSDRVLEVGSGHGRTLEGAAAALTTGSIAGVDLSEEMVRLASHRCGRLMREGKVAVTVGSSEHLPFPDQHFDKALAVHTVYFWSDPHAHLQEIRRVLRGDGRFVLVCRSKDDAKAGDFPESVYRFYTSDEMILLLEASGFPRVEVTRTVDGLVAATAYRLPHSGQVSPGA
jgi:ubiquinone/menaquinone biosynthesis C-methylase UbiE